MKERVLIIGCGYVGLPLGAELARQGHEVFGLRRTTSAAAALHAVGITLLPGDITQPETLQMISQPFDWVVNCAASGGGDAAAYRQLYLQGTRNVLAWLATRPLLKYVYTSSTSVYGQDDGSWVDESSAAEPSTDTGRILVETESLLRTAADERNFPAVILRLAGIYGPERGYWFKQLLQGEARISGDGKRSLNMIHRDDVVGCIIAALRQAQAGGIYNAIDDEPVTQVEFFRWLCNRLNKPMPPCVSPNTESEGKRGVTDKKVSNHKLKRELGYRFKFANFREGYAAEMLRLGL